MIRMSYVRSVAATLATVALAIRPVAAQAPVTIDFAEFRSPTTIEYQATPGGDVTSKGFDFYAYFGAGARNALQTWGTEEDAVNLPRNLGPTAGALFATRFLERIDMETSSGKLFNLFSIAVAHVYDRSSLVTGDLSPISLFFYGRNAAGQNSVFASFNIPAPTIVGPNQSPVLFTLLFPPTWRALSSVEWYQASGASNAQIAGSAVSHQFTNIVAEVVPEPNTYLLMTTGVIGLLLITRRRRAL